MLKEVYSRCSYKIVGVLTVLEHFARICQDYSVFKIKRAGFPRQGHAVKIVTERLSSATPRHSGQSGSDLWTTWPAARPSAERLDSYWYAAFLIIKAFEKKKRWPWQWPWDNCLLKRGRRTRDRRNWSLLIPLAFFSRIPDKQREKTWTSLAKKQAIGNNRFRESLMEGKFAAFFSQLVMILTKQ